MTASLLFDRLLIATMYPLFYPFWLYLTYAMGRVELEREPTMEETTWVLHESMVCLWNGEEP